MATKIRLSAKEKELVLSERFILTKNRIMDKAMLLLGQWKLAYDELLQGVELPAGTASAKISRGEHYQGLPWLMLDHPRYFTKTEVLAIRSFFWWGKFFSITLQLAGAPKINAEASLEKGFKRLRKAGAFICVNEDPWQHDMGKENYRSLKDMKRKEFNALIRTKTFLKISFCFRLKKWERTSRKMKQCFGELIQLTGLSHANSPTGGKGL